MRPPRRLSACSRDRPVGGIAFPLEEGAAGDRRQLADRPGVAIGVRRRRVGGAVAVGAAARQRPGWLGRYLPLALPRHWGARSLLRSRRVSLGEATMYKITNIDEIVAVKPTRTP